MSESVVEVEGMLVKSPPHQRDIFGKLKRWRKRYCVLRRSKSRERGATLSYYETQEAYIYGTKSKGELEIFQSVWNRCSTKLMQKQQYTNVILVRAKMSKKCVVQAWTQWANTDLSDTDLRAGFRFSTWDFQFHFNCVILALSFSIPFFCNSLLCWVDHAYRCSIKCTLQTLGIQHGDQLALCH